MSVAAFAERYGPATSLVDATEAYFRAQGVRVSGLSADHLVLSLAGSAGDLGRAFRTTLVAGYNGSDPVVFPSLPPSLPASLQATIAGVVGLSSGFDRFSFSLSPPAAGPGALSPGTITPARARAIYDLSGLYNLTGGASNASGQTIAVVLWGEGYAPSDLAHFFANYYPSSFPSPAYAAYPVNGAPNASASALTSPDLAAVEELTLDIEWSASMAPGATIAAVYTRDGPASSNYSPSPVDLTTAFETALGLRSTTNLTAISMSFGSSESRDASLISSWAPLFSEAQQLGVTVLAAAGDTGGDTSVCSGTPDPQFPSSSPDVLAVGGTQVTLTGSVLGGGFSESAWTAGGGGFSQTYPAPSWQEVGSAAAPIAANGHRGMPDVSATAVNNFVYVNGAAASADGTSFGTPLWAGLVASLDAKWGHPLGFFTDRLYHLVANQTSGGIGVADVQGGSNCVASAVAGWDAVTGWGSPRAAALYAELTGSFVHLGLSVRPSPVAPGGSLTVSVDLSNLSSGQPIAGQSVGITLASTLSAGPCTGRFGSTTVSTDANGTASARLAVPLCYFGTHVRVVAQVTTVRYYGSNATSVPVNLLGWFPQLGFLASPPWEFVTFLLILAVAVAAGVGLGRLLRPRRGASVAAPSGSALEGPPGPPSPWSGPEPPPPTPPPSPASNGTVAPPPSVPRDADAPVADETSVPGRVDPGVPATGASDDPALSEDQQAAPESQTPEVLPGETGDADGDEESEGVPVRRSAPKRTRRRSPPKSQKS